MKHNLHEVISSDITRQRVTREIKRFCAIQRIDDTQFLTDIEMSHFIDHMANALVMKLTAKVASKVYDVKTVKFPSDWWQCFKKAYFPMWALVKWPVHYTEITMEANAYHPDIRIPDHQTFVDILMSSKYNVWEDEA